MQERKGYPMVVARFIPNLPFSMKKLAPKVLAYAFAVGSLASAVFADSRDEKPVKMDAVVVQETKTHTLFMGTDISLNLDRDLYPVRDVEGGSWVVEINHQQRVISAKSAPVNLKITPSLKLSEMSATIEGFSGVRGYTFDNDPSVRLTRGMASAEMSNFMLQGVASDARNLSDTLGNKALGPASTFAAADKQFGDAALLLSAQTSPAIKHPPKAIPGVAVPANPLVNTTFDGKDGQGLAILEAGLAEQKADGMAANGNEPGGRLTRAGVDAMEVDFHISSAKPLYEPYIVTITKFHDQNGPRGTVQSLVYAKSLDPILKEKSHVQFTEGGFPFDFELIDFQVHLYDRGVEIPTNLSRDRVEMTRTEAFEYVKMEYLGAHRSATLPPTPAMGKLPSDLPNKLATGKYGETFYVKVSRDGLAEAPFADAECTRRIDDPFLVSVVTSLRFKPALNQGKPVEGISALNLSKLTI
jgi:hypothetical protein